MKRQIESLTDDSMAPVFDTGHTVNKAEKFGWKEIGAMGTFRLISKKDLKIDRAYQRDKVSVHKLVDIAKGFDWALFGTLSVAESPEG